MKLYAIAKTVNGTTKLVQESRPYGFVAVLAFADRDEAERYAAHITPDHAPSLLLAGIDIRYGVVEIGGACQVLGSKDD